MSWYERAIICSCVADLQSMQPCYAVTAYADAHCRMIAGQDADAREERHCAD